MPTLAHPLHTARVAGADVRIFPHPTQRAGAPWYATDDVAAALTLPQDVRRGLLWSLRTERPTRCVTIMTVDGPTLVQAGETLNRLIVPAIVLGCAPRAFVDDLMAACDAVLDVPRQRLTADEFAEAQVAAMADAVCARICFWTPAPRTVAA